MCFIPTFHVCSTLNHWQFTLIHFQSLIPPTKYSHLTLFSCPLPPLNCFQTQALVCPFPTTSRAGSEKRFGSPSGSHFAPGSSAGLGPEEKHIRGIHCFYSMLKWFRRTSSNTTSLSGNMLLGDGPLLCAFGAVAMLTSLKRKISASDVGSSSSGVEVACWCFSE